MCSETRKSNNRKAAEEKEKSKEKLCTHPFVFANRYETDPFSSLVLLYHFHLTFNNNNKKTTKKKEERKVERRRRKKKKEEERRRKKKKKEEEERRGERKVYLKPVPVERWVD